MPITGDYQHTQHAQMVYGTKYKIIFYEMKNIRQKIAKCIYLNYYYKLFQANGLVPSNFVCNNFLLQSHYYYELINFQNRIFVKHVMKNKQRLYTYKLYYHRLLTSFLHLFDEFTRVTTMRYLNSFAAGLDRQNYKMLRNKIRHFKSLDLNTDIFFSAKQSYTFGHHYPPPSTSFPVQHFHQKNSSFITHPPTVIINQKGFENFTNVAFSPQQLTILEMGPKATIMPPIHKYDTLLYKTESMFLTQTLEPYLVRPANNNVLQPLLDNFSSSYRTPNQQTSLHQNNKTIAQNIVRKQVKAINLTLTDNKALIVHADKSNTLIAVYSNQYITDMEIALAKNNFVKVSKDKNQTLHYKFKVFLHSLYASGVFDSKLYNRIYPVNSYTSPIYGQYKSHKKEGGYRPLVATTSAYYANASKWLYQILAKYSHSRYNVKNTTQFIYEISKVEIKPQYRLVSFDVESLYGLVDKELVLDKLIYRYRADKHKLFKMKLDDLRQMLDYCINNLPCVFNNVPYTQLEGVAMGSALSSLMADIQMDIFEAYIDKIKNLTTGHLRKVHFYRRYVDDIVAIVSKEEYILEVLQEFNRFSDKLKFTYEAESSNVLNFLDTTIIRRQNNLDFTVFRKPTQNTLKINYYSTYSYSVKANIIKQDIIRALKTCTNQYLLNIEFNNIRMIYTSNDYPVMVINNLIDLCTRNFINRFSPIFSVFHPPPP